jgi:hypothetical protein
MGSYAEGAAPQAFEMAVDSDDAVFVDYLHFWDQEEHDDNVFRLGFKAHRDYAEKGLEDSPHHVRAKYEWLASYHNWTAEALRGHGRVKIRDWPAGQFRRF